MVDRQARDAMAGALRAYMAEAITAFQFDDLVSDSTVGTEDETVVLMYQELWRYYDEISDHNICATKESWDYLNRILLLLESDAEMVAVRSRRSWDWQQLVAGFSLLSLIILTLVNGWGPSVMLYAFFLGIVSMVLAWSRSWERKNIDPKLNAMEPFATLTSMVGVRKSVPAFLRIPFRPELAFRRVHSRFFEYAMMPPALLLWIFCGPLVLAVQLYWGRRTDYEIRLPT